MPSFSHAGLRANSFVSPCKSCVDLAGVLLFKREPHGMNYFEYNWKY